MIIEEVKNFNKLLRNPTIQSIQALFEPDSHIRFNNIFISPISLIDFKRKLDELGLIEMEVVNEGLIFNFGSATIHFHGFYEVFSRNRLFSFEFNFKPVSNSEEGNSLMAEIESFLKKYDAMFFLTQSINVDGVILHSSMSNSLPFLTKRYKDDGEEDV